MSRHPGTLYRIVTAVCFVATLVSETPQKADAADWVEATGSAAWPAKSRHASEVFDGRMWVMGGEHAGSGLSNDVWSSVDGATWNLETSGAPWPGRIDFVALTYSGRLWIMGGYAVGTDVWYTTNGSAWTQAASDAGWGGNRWHFTGVVFDGRMWVLNALGGGQSNDVWYSTNGSNWTQATGNAPWDDRYATRTAVYDGRMWITGGAGSPANDVWYSTNGANWTEATGAAPWVGRAFHGAAGYDNKLWVLSGGTNDVWHSTNGGTWTQQTASAGWVGRILHTTLVYEERLWIIGGQNGGRLNDVWSLEACDSASINVPPAADTICEGGTAALSVAAGGDAPLDYQWRKDGNDLTDGGNVSGATTDTLTIDPASSGDEGDYDVVVTNACGSATSAAATLTVLGGPDCNGNSTPDECDVYFGTSADCDGDDVPDECEEDCDGNDTPDECEAGSGVFTWTGLDGASFSNGNNWSPSGGPGPSGRAAMSNASGDDNRAVVDDGSLPQVCFIDISASGSGRQILQVNQDFVLSTFSGISVSAGGELDLRGGEVSGGTIVNTSNTVRGYGVISADIDNQGLLQGRLGRLLELTGSSTANQSSGTVLASFASLIDIQSASVSQEGEMRIETLGGLHFDGPVTNAAGASIEILGGSLGATTLTNEDGASLIGTGDILANVLNDGTITAIADLQVFGSLHNDGTILIQNGVLTVTGSVTGSGVIIGGFGG